MGQFVEELGIVGEDEGMPVCAVMRRGFVGFEQAHTLYCLGYSVPLTDFSVRALLRAGRKVKRIIVANPNAEAAERLGDVLPSASLEHIGKDEDADPIRVLVAEYVAQ